MKRNYRTVETGPTKGCGRIFSLLAHFWSHEFPITASEERRDLGKKLQVLLDGESIAELDWIQDDQLVRVYGLTLIDPDHSKTEFALRSGGDAVHEADRVLIQDRTYGWLVVPYLFLPHISWEHNIVTVREANRFEPPPRDPIPEDKIPGYGSIAEAHRIIQEEVRLERESMRIYWDSKS